MSNIVFEKFSPFNASPALITDLIECYREVYAVAPWHEMLKCRNPHCDAHWGRAQAAEIAAQQFMHCGESVTEFWPYAKVLSDLRADSVDGSSFWIATEVNNDERRVIGMACGTPMERGWSHLNAEHTDALIREFGEDVRHNPEFVYQADLIVHASYRKHGIARALTERRHQDFLALGYKVGIVRVREKPDPSVTYLWFIRKGYRVVERFDDGRVLLACTLSPDQFR